jgi:hypothetical protein
MHGLNAPVFPVHLLLEHGGVAFTPIDRNQNPLEMREMFHGQALEMRFCLAMREFTQRAPTGAASPDDLRN